MAEWEEYDFGQGEPGEEEAEQPLAGDQDDPAFRSGGSRGRPRGRGPGGGRGGGGRGGLAQGLHGSREEGVQAVPLSALRGAYQVPCKVLRAPPPVVPEHGVSAVSHSGC